METEIGFRGSASNNPNLAADGAIDLCQQALVSGWAVDAGQPATVEIFLNKERVGSVTAGHPRPDVAVAYGYPATCGFFFQTPRSILASDEIEVVLVQSGMRLKPDPHHKRVERFIYGVDRGKLGLEIGPLDRPFLDKTNFNVLYSDHASTDELREKYKSTGSAATFDADSLVDVDVVWSPGKALIDCVGARKFDYVIASQTMEHVADPVGWLNEIAAVTRPGGRINLSLPEKTRTFDHCRQLSTAADMISAYRQNTKIPSFRSVFDHIVTVAQPPTIPVQTDQLIAEAYAVASAAAAGQYVDVHVHVWTHDSFLGCWHIINSLGIADVLLDKSWPAFAGSNEFMLSFVVK